MRRLLYKQNSSGFAAVYKQNSSGFAAENKVRLKDGKDREIKNITLSVFGKLYIEGEVHNIKTTLSRLRFALISGNKAKIFYVKDGEKVIHASYVIPKCAKFPFLGKGDFEIGPCYTDRDYRGQGVYPCVLKYIVSHGGGTI